MSTTEPNMAEKNHAMFLHKEDGEKVGSGASPKPQEVTTIMIVFSMFISISATICNFDLGYGGTVLLMKPFNDAFGPCHEVLDPQSQAPIQMCQVTALQQSLVGLTSLFIAIGGALSGPVSTYLGRRGVIQCGCLIVLIGAAGMLGTSGHFVNYMVCKSINGVGLGLLYSGTVVYGVECVAPQKRGLLLSLYTIGLALGNALAAGVCAGSSEIASDWAWKTPIACQIPLSVLLGAGVMAFPESPRWLLMKGNETSARKAFARFHSKDHSSKAITLQVQEVRSYLEHEKEMSSTTSWMEIFHRKSIRRTLVSVLTLTGTSFAGIQFVAPYTAIFLGGLGIANPFIITVIISVCFFAGSLIGGPVIEYGGRRFALIAGYSILATCMLIFSAVSSGLGASSDSAMKVLVAFLCIWAFTFSGFIAPAAWIASTEVHSVRLRIYGQGFTVYINSIFGFATGFWTPYMLNKDYGNMGTNVGYFYFGTTVATLILVVIFFPETARLKLEQIDDYFESGLPAWKTSLGRNKKLAMENILENATGLASEQK